MRVLLSDELFRRDSNILELIALFQIGSEGRHALQLQSSSSLVFDAWLEQRDKIVQEECKLALATGLSVDAHFPSCKQVQVKPLGPSDWKSKIPNLYLKDALGLLRSPLELWVENARNDRAFIFAMARGPRKNYLEKLEKENALRFVPGGGITEMKNLIQGKSQNFKEAFQMFVIFDSDALHPGQPSQQSNKLKEQCEEENIPFHQLHRRAIENYIPLDALQLWKDRDQKQKSSRRKSVNAFEKLTQDQRNHYNMKSGFAGDAQRVAQEGAPPLYDGLSEDRRNALQNGFGKDISVLFVEPLEEKWLKNSQCTNEADAMIQEILKLI